MIFNNCLHIFFRFTVNLYQVIPVESSSSHGYCRFWKLVASMPILASFAASQWQLDYTISVNLEIKKYISFSVCFCHLPNMSQISQLLNFDLHQDFSTLSHSAQDIGKIHPYRYISKASLMFLLIFINQNCEYLRIQQTTFCFQ